VVSRPSPLLQTMNSTSPQTSSPPEQPARLAQLGTILIAGADARSFLQGQLTADLDMLDRHRALLAACNSSQGRVQAIFWMIERSDGIALVLPSVMLETTIARLRKYVLRSKVKIDPAAILDVSVLEREALPAAVSLTEPRSHHELDAVSYVSLPGHDRILVLNAPGNGLDSDAQARWHLDDIRAGLPQIYPQTHEAFVAQMLNLDLLDGINFEKGCYTGQEIIARTHFRGAVKRRMFRYTANCPPPAPGARIVVADQHAGDVVDSTATGEGCELLAVVSLAQIEERLSLEGSPEAALERMPLPYPLTR
jgi:tRNA-modifying protein YgfZ